MESRREHVDVGGEAGRPGDDLWTYRSGVELGDAAGARRLDLEGFRIEATDGAAGEAAEATHEPGAGYLAVTVGVAPVERVAVPAGLVAAVDPSKRRIHVDATRTQIKTAPEAPFGAMTPEIQAEIAEHYGRSAGDSLR